MTNPDQALQALLQSNAGKPGEFPPTSRYANVEVAQWRLPDGRIIPYLRRRYVPPPEAFAELQEYRVKQGDRLDNLAAQFLGDPEQFWKLCDANRALDPDELIELGRTLRITLPEGIPGTPHA